MRGGARSRALVAAVALTLGCSVAVAAPAQAASYPSWSEVQKARANAATKAKAVARIRGLITESKAAVEKARRAAEQRGAEYAVTRDSADEANDRLVAVEREVAANRRRAREARQRAGQMAATLARTGGTDLRTTLFLEGSSSSGGAAAFLSKLGRLSMLTEANGSIADAAEQAENAAAATQSQFAEVTDELAALRQKAQEALAAAVEASDAADAQLKRQQDLQITLDAQLKLLEAKAGATSASYRAGVEARKRAAAAAQGGAGGSTSALPSGWALPVSGWISDDFGARPDRPAGANPFHRGTDLAAPCGRPIYAAHAGTVTFAGSSGSYGNLIEIDNGGSISTAYAHILGGGVFVRAGQRVRAGQNIASVGTTGASTGCHLHFEVRSRGSAINPVPFMGARGVTLG